MSPFTSASSRIPWVPIRLGRIQDTVHSIQDTGYRIQDTVYRIQYTGYSIQNTGYSVLYPVSSNNDHRNIHRIQDTENMIQATR